MKRKTLQEQYNQIKKGKGNKEIFLKEAKKIFPNYIHNVATFSQAEKILKQKSIISENMWGVTTGKNEQPDWFKIFNENINIINEVKELEKIIKNTKVTGTIKDLEAKVKLKAKEAGLDITDGEIEDAIEKHADMALGLFEAKSLEDIVKSTTVDGSIADLEKAVMAKAKEEGLNATADEVEMAVEKHADMALGLFEAKERYNDIKGLNREFGDSDDEFTSGIQRFWRNDGKGTNVYAYNDSIKEPIAETPKHILVKGYEDYGDDEKNAYIVINKKKREIIDYQVWEYDKLLPKYFKNIKLNRTSAYESINEEVKAVEKKTSKEVTDLAEKNFDYKDKKDVNNVYGEAFLKGYYTEMKDPKNTDKTIDELKEIVAKNLAKDQLHYVKDGQFGEKGVGYTDEAPGLKASKSDQMEKVKLKENLETHDSKKAKPKKKKPKKETIETKLAEIDKASSIVALETKIEALAEIIESKMQRLSMVSEDENLSELMDKKKIKEMQKEIKLLEKRKAGFEKLYEKSCGKKYQQQEIVGEVTEEEEITESKKKTIGLK